MVVLGLSGDGLFGEESTTTVDNFRRQTGVSFPILLRDQTRLAYGKKIRPHISPFPFDVLVDRQGNIRHVAQRFDPVELRQLIEQLLAEPAP